MSRGAEALSDHLKSCASLRPQCDVSANGFEGAFLGCMERVSGKQGAENDRHFGKSKSGTEAVPVSSSESRELMWGKVSLEESLRVESLRMRIEFWILLNRKDRSSEDDAGRDVPIL